MEVLSDCTATLASVPLIFAPDVFHRLFISLFSVKLAMEICQIVSLK